MDAAVIDKYVSARIDKAETVDIHFKDRRTVTGLFIHSADYDELKAKNFWRIVNNDQIVQWKQTKDINLARIFNGASFIRLKASNN